MVRKRMKKILAAVLASAMVFGCVPASAFPVAAAENVSEPVAQAELSVAFDQEYAAVSQELSVTVTGGSNVTYTWYIGGKKIDNNTNSYIPTDADLEKWIEVVVKSGAATASTKMYFSELPVVYINTEGGQAITSKEKYIDADLKIQGNQEFNSETTDLYDGLTEIRGRGNSTWSQPKKPYRLKLDKKTDLLGMGKSKHWVLLANYMDESLMRNTYAYDLSGDMGMPQMATVWVNVVLNGDMVGNYQLCENIRADGNRVDVFDWEGFCEDAAAAIAEAEGMDDDTAGDLETYMAEESMQWITSGKVTFNGKTYNIANYEDIEVPGIDGGYILELDEYYDEVSKFKTASGQPIMFKNPEFVYTNTDMMKYVQTYVQAFENAVQSDDYTAVYDGEATHYSDLYDFDSLVDYWLIGEIFFQEELNKKSTYMYKEIGELMKMGPIWDMDWSSGGEGDTQHTNRWATLHFNANAQARQWYKYLVQDPYFLMKAQERYWEIRYNQLQNMLDRFDDDYEYLKKSAEANGARWGYGQSYEYYANHFDTWMNTHVAWMDEQMATESAFDSSFYKANSGIQITLADYNGDELKGDIALKAAADYVVGTDENIVVFVNGTNGVSGDANVFVNSKLVAELRIGSGEAVVEIDASELTADANEKNVIEVKTANASNYVTVKEKAIGSESDVDKTELEELIYEVADLKESNYSSATWAPFEEAYINACITAINSNSTKEEVDAAKEALQEAYDNLVEIRDPADASDDLDVKKMTVTAGSAQDGEGIELALDGNENTLWHTQYSPHLDWYGTPEALNHFWVEFDLGEETIVDAVRYLPRNNNGDIKSYKVEGSLDGENWYPLAEGDWDYNGVEWQSAEFDAVKVTHIRLWATATQSSSGTNRHMSARELRIRTADKEVTPLPIPGAADKSVLEAKLTEYAAVDTTVYTEETAKAFDEAFTAAKAVLIKEDAVQGEVDEAIAALDAAYAALEEKPEPTPTPGENPSNIIPVSEMKATAGDEELVNSDISVEGPASLAIDENEATIWHTDWYVGPSYDNHWLQLELNNAYIVDSFRYLPRQSGNTNGIITSYKILVSMDGQEWTEAAAGSWDSSDRDWKVAQFDAVKAKYVRLKVEDAESDIGICLSCAAEVRLTGVVVSCDAHTTELVGKKDATCTEAGYTGDETCTKCGFVVTKGEEIEALGHAWGEAVVVEASCTENGSSTKTCATCGEKEVEVLKAIGHAWGEWTVTKEATETEEGEKEHICANCNETETETIPALGEVEPTPTPTPEPGNPFEDVIEGQYYYDPVLWAVEKGVTSGLNATTFGVGNDCTREQIVTFLWNYAGKPAASQTECTFKDVNPDHYYYNAMLWANEKGYVSGYNADTFGVGDACTREQIVMILWKFAGEPAAEQTTCTFEDADASHYYYNAMLWAVENKVVAGYNDAEFGVGDACTREQIVTFLYRYDNLEK